MQQKSFGLDIGTAEIKIAEIGIDNKTFILKSCNQMSSPGRGIASEAIDDEQEVAQTIRKMMQESKIETKSVHIALAEHQVYSRVIEMPKLSEKELSTAIYWEAEQYIPVPLSTITFDYKILTTTMDPNSAKMQVLLVGAPTVLIGKYQKVASFSGLEPVSIETEMLSILRTLSYVYKFNLLHHVPIVVVHIGASTTSLGIIRNGLLMFTYAIAMGGVTLTRAIASEFGFAQTQAEEYKKAYGLDPNQLTGRIAKACEPVLLSIVSEIKKAFLYYGEKYPQEEQIQQIVLLGGSAKLAGLNLFFTRNCGVETVIGDPLKVFGNQKLPEAVVKNAPDYSVVIGLALKGYE